jgi:hypothetical protein
MATLKLVSFQNFEQFVAVSSFTFRFTADEAYDGALWQLRFQSGDRELTGSNGSDQLLKANAADECRNPGR